MDAQEDHEPPPSTTPQVFLLWFVAATGLCEADAKEHVDYLNDEGITSVTNLREVDEANDWNDLKIPLGTRSKIKLALRKKAKVASDLMDADTPAILEPAESSASTLTGVTIASDCAAPHPAFDPANVTVSDNLSDNLSRQETSNTCAACNDTLHSNLHSCSHCQRHIHSFGMCVECVQL